MGIVVVAFALGLAAVSQFAVAVTPVTVTAKLVASDGSPISDARARYGSGANYSTAWFTGGGGYTDANGETTMQLAPGTYSFEMVHAATAQRKISVPVSGDVTLTFYTTKVTIQYTDQVAYGGANGDSTWFKQTKGTASKELLGDGVTTTRFRLHGTGVAKGRLGLVIPQAGRTGVSMVRSFIALHLVDSTGAALDGATARYKNGSWAYAPGSTGIEPLAPGVLAYAVPGLATDITNEMRFNGTTQTKAQDPSVNSVYQFQTRLLTLRLESCSTGDPLDGGRPRFGIGDTNYWTMWYPGGATGASAPGECAAQVFPGTYSFEMQYKATADRKLAEVVPDADATITWKTTKVTLNYSGSISYGGATGDSTWFVKPSMELLPGTYTFHFRGGDRVDLTIAGCAVEKTAAALKVVESDGVTGVSGVTFEWQVWGSPPDRPVPGATNASGILLHIMDGYNNTSTRYLPKYMGGVGPRMDPKPATQSFVNWKLIKVKVRLTDVNGGVIGSASPVVKFEYPNGGRWTFGTLAGGEASLEMMPTGGYVAFFIDNYNETKARVNASPMLAGPYVVTFPCGRIVDTAGYLNHWRISGGNNMFGTGAGYALDVLPSTSFYFYPTANESPRQGPISIGEGKTLTFTDAAGNYTITP